MPRGCPVTVAALDREFVLHRGRRVTVWQVRRRQSRRSVPVHSHRGPRSRPHLPDALRAHVDVAHEPGHRRSPLQPCSPATSRTPSQREIVTWQATQMSLAEDQHRSVSSDLTVNTNLSANQFALGQRGGIFTAAIPALARTASKDVVN